MPLEFMPLRELRYEVAGFFDGERSNVSVSFSQDPMVACHEGVHAEVMHFTTDGAILGTCLVIANKGCCLSPSLKDDYSRLTDALLESSLEAHEAVATYMGLALFPLPIRTSMILALPAVYRDYHEKMAWIDAITPSRYLRHNLAWNIALVVFCSPFLRRLVASGPGAVLPLKGLEKSNVRLKMVSQKLQSVSHSTIKELYRSAAAKRCAQLGISIWELDDDEAWHSNPGVSEIVIEFAATEFRRWLVENVPMEELRDPDRAAAEDAFMVMQRTIGINVVDVRPPPEERNVSTLKSEKLWEAKNASHSRLLNPRALLPEEGDPETLVNGTIFLGGPCAVAITNGDRGRDWHLFQWGAPEKLPIKVDRFSENVFLEFLSRMRQLEINGLPIPRFLSVVAIVQNMREAVSVGHAMCSVPQAVSGKFVWYFMGDWCLLIEGMTAACKPVISMSLGHINATPGQSASQLDGIETKVLASSRAGIYIRSFDRRSAAAILSFEDEFQKKGWLVPVQSADKERLIQIVRPATQMVWPLMREF